MSERDNTGGRSRRKHRRVPAREVTAEIRSRGGIFFSYTVLNISTGGVLITGGQPPPRGKIEIEIKQGGAKAVSVLGRVVHELAEGVGVAFEPMTLEVAASLEKMIAAVEAKSGMPPPLPTNRPSKDDVIPPPGERPTADPFAIGVDPRPPRAGSPDERADYLRTLVKRRDEALARGRVVYAAAIAEADEVRVVATRLKTKLESAVSQVALGEAALTATRKAVDEADEALKLERAASEERLNHEARQTLEAIATVAGLEAKMRRFETQAASARAEAEAARRETNEVVSETAALRRSREELVAANKKAMEAQAALNKERTLRATAEAPLAEARAALQAQEAENKKLQSELARLKSKLITAENALEARSTRKARPG